MASRTRTFQSAGDAARGRRRRRRALSYPAKVLATFTRAWIRDSPKVLNASRVGINCDQSHAERPCPVRCTCTTPPTLTKYELSSGAWRASAPFDDSCAQVDNVTRAGFPSRILTRVNVIKRSYSRTLQLPAILFYAIA